MAETVMAGYRIATTSLTRKSGGKDVTTTGQSGLVNTRSELKDFIEGYKKYGHDCPMVLLSNNLSREFADWLVRHEAVRKGTRMENVGTIAGFISSVVSGNPLSLASWGMKTAGLVAGDARYVKEEYEFLVLHCHFRCTYNCGRIGVFLHETEDGSPSETVWGPRGTAWSLARLRGERFLG